MPNFVMHALHFGISFITTCVFRGFRSSAMWNCRARRAGWERTKHSIPASMPARCQF